MGVYADREIEMAQELSLDQKKTTVLAAVIIVLLGLVFIAGYLSGIIVGLPEIEQQPVVNAPVVKQTPAPAPSIVTMQVPRVAEEPEPEELEEIEEPEPGEVEEIEEPEPEEENIPQEKLYSVQVGSFRTQERANAQVQRLIAKGYSPYIYHGANSKGALWYTVRIADFADVEEAIGAAREFRTREDLAVALTHYDSLMLVKTPEGKRIEIEPFESTASGEEVVVDKTGGDDFAKLPEDRTTKEIKAGGDGSISGSEAAGGDEPESESDLENPERKKDESDPDAESLSGTDVQAGGAKDSSTKFQEDEDQAGLSSQISTGQSPEPDTGEVSTETGNQITFAVPEKTAQESEGVGGLIAAAEANNYSVQVGAFLKTENADKFAKKLKGRGYPAYVFHYVDSAGNAWNAVRAGDYRNLAAAREAAADFEGKESITAIVTRIDAISMVTGE